MPSQASPSGAPRAAPDPLPGWLAGESPALVAFLRELQRVGASDVSVLIEGESGAGKNLTARALHERSARAGGPLVEVDLSALTPTLIEAELFGHTAGAFTGATRERTGRFVRAHGGTLVLDGIERLAESVQAKLLRTLQERVVEPLGSETAVPIDVRVIATSSTPLAERVAARKFREDLYYRLAVVTLVVPPLRRRAEDIPALAAVEVQRASEQAAVAPRTLTPAALKRLEAHAWPGNLREFENALLRVLVLNAGAAGPIEAAEFDFLAESVAGVPERLAREALAHGVSLERFEIALMDEAVRETRGNVTAAAKLVGLTRRAFELRHGRAHAANGDTPVDADK
ncbi:MAG: sigma-54-dependent Fis family transcriptional regulator [Planctomycetes bacterium]|nr:sigma-54-dependent Fis family transcriptional regulator [Planctomycetota bacterium]